MQCRVRYLLDFDLKIRSGQVCSHHLLARVDKSLVEIDPLSKVGCHNVHNLLVEKRKSFRFTTYILLPFD